MRRLLVLPLTALLVCATAMSATAGSARPNESRLFIPPPTAAAVTQIEQLAKAGDWRDALLVARMVTTPQAVWLTSGTPAQAQTQVQTTMAAAARQRAVPTFVAYDVPGRDCAQFSAGGALDEASYDAWIDGVAAGIGQRSATVILEPDALGLLPSSCGLSTTVYPFTDVQRYAELNHAVTALAADRNVSLYLDGTHSAWQSVGTISQRLITAGVQRAKGVFVNVSNYQPTPELVDYGTWISDCIAIVTDTANPLFNNPGACASQYFPATQSDFSTWGLTTQWYAQHLGTSTPTEHFVIDTSRNGDGPNAMTKFAAAPFNQPASVISTLAGGSWCDPPDSGLGLRPTTRTGTPLLDAYLWVKIPGQSDGQCDAAGGVRAWDYSLYTQPSWPTDPAAQRLFDPLWGMNDPAAGAWFPQQALQLAQDASPSLR
ncbi:MAG TPA: glycoside hydrolase family 6 protein [Pseudonocardiaceae bacterium]